MGVHSSAGRGVVKGNGISSSKPLHKLVGVAMIAGIVVAVRAAVLVGDGVLEGGILVGVGINISSSVLVQAVNSKMPMIVRIRSLKLKFPRVAIVSPPKSIKGNRYG